MFYVLSKIIGLFINPIIWILGLLIFSFSVKSPKRKKQLLLVTIAFIWIFSNSFILNEFLCKWEKKSVAYSKLKPTYDYGIVLSGMIWYDHETDRINFLQSSDRIWQAVKLYRENKIEKILIAGGAAGFFEKDTIESVLLKDFLVKIGIPGDDIITETLSRNTYENATYTAELLKTEPNAELLLITSAMHMRRANGCFAKAGLKCDLYPTDHYSGARKFNAVNLFVPNARTLFNWKAFIHELFGIASYKIAGYL